jgi:deoxyribodipyrimidine photolyase-related protein
MTNRTLHIIFPVNLYSNNKYLTANKDICVFEDPVYFTQYNFHKMKLLYHRITMKKYFDGLIHSKKKYYDFKTDIFKIIKKYDTIEFIYPHDKIITDKYIKFCNKTKINLVILESQNFMINTKDIMDYTGAIYHDRSFYPYMRKKFNIFMTKDNKPIGDKYSFDKDNRKKIVLGKPKIVVNRDKYYIEAEKYVDKYFHDNYGEYDMMMYPTTRNESMSLLKKFCKNKLNHFGDYEDAIDKDNSFLYHSQLSSCMNIGLITDKDVVDYVLKYYKANKVSYNNVEGFIRQIIGWRNYVYLIYEKFSHTIRKSNHLNHTNKLTHKFYNGTTQIPIIDDTIKKALKFCYLNHIERLMIMGNFMLLCKIKPQEVMKWFFELVSIDAYDVFMVPNVLCMSQFADGGLMMNRPYFCSSNYLLKMSNYKKNDGIVKLRSGEYDWTYIFDCLYYNFIVDNKKTLSKIYATASMVKLSEKKDGLKTMINIAEEYIDFLSTP